MKVYYRMWAGWLLACLFFAPIVLFAQVVNCANGAVEQIVPLSAQKPYKRKLMQASVSGAKAYVKSEDYFVIQYATTPSAEVQERIARYATRVAHVQDNMYLYHAADAEVAIGAIQLLADLPSITAKGRLPLAFKLVPELYTCYKGNKPLPATITTQGVEVQVYDIESLDALCRTLDRWKVGYERLSRSVRLTAPTLDVVAQLAEIPYVALLMPYAEPKPLSGFDYAYITQANKAPIVNYDMHEDMPIGRGIYLQNWEPFGKEARYALNAYGRTFDDGNDFVKEWGHGTNCSLIAAGANNVDEVENMGMAPGMIHVQGNSGTYGTELSGLLKLKAKVNAPVVTTHSVGHDPKYGYIYDEKAAQIDKVMYESNDYVHCYPTGNNASGGYGYLTGAYKLNKNGFNVHSTQYVGVDVPWTNYGPTIDGRMHPNICAQGTAGSSYACPGVAGAVGLVMEQFAKTYPTLPMHADVCQAVLLNTAIDVRNVTAETANTPDVNMIGIDYRTGFGEINVPAALKAIAEKRVIFGDDAKAADTYKKTTHTIKVGEGQTELRVMLYWHEPPSVPPMAARPMINELDMIVVTPNGEEIKPWALNRDLPAQKPRRAAVNEDNAEQVVIRAANKGETLVSGDYEVQVKSWIKEPPHKYVITWQTRPRGIIMTSIPEGQRFTPGQSFLLTWDMTLPDDEELTAWDGSQGATTPDVYYRTSATGEYVKATPTKPSARGKNFFEVKLPEGMPSTNELQFKVQLPNDASVFAESNKAQVEKRMNRPRVKSYTANSVRLEWDAVPSVTQGRYIIYALYDKYMTPIDSVDIGTTTKDVPAPAGVSWDKGHYFAVAVRNTAAHTLGQRSLPIGLDQMNEEATSGGELWASSYTICGSAYQTIRTIASYDGKVQWYVDGRAVAAPEGNAHSLELNEKRMGTIYYTVSNEAGQVYYTSSATVLNPRVTSLNDTAQWGTRYWTGFVFDNPTQNTNFPLLKDGLVLAGRFNLGKLGFNSNEDLFKWDGQSPENITNYVGCASGSKHARVIVLKRTGFAKGDYKFTVKRASVRVEIIVRDGNGQEIKRFKSSFNSQNESPFTVALDPTSQVEIHWIGDHANIAIDYTPATDIQPVNFRPISGRFYRFINAYSGYLTTQKVEKAAYMPYDGNTLRWKSVNNSEVAFLWQYDGTWPNGTLMQANTLKSNSSAPDVPWYMNTAGSKEFAKNTTAAPATFATLTTTDNQVSVRINNRQMHTEGHDNGKGGAGNLIGSDGAAGSTSAWYMEEAKTIDLQVSYLGFATVCYPFHVRLPKDAGFKAYAITGVSGSEVQLTQLSAETSVPKGTPMLIEAPAGKYTFTIDYDYTLQTQTGGAPLTPNEHAYYTQIAHATYAPANVPEGTFVLANGENGIGFYPIEAAGTLAENRLYLPADVLGVSAGGRPLSLVVTDLGGIVTRIRQTPAATTPAEYYDITGRRIYTPQPGLRLGSDGSKILTP